MSADDVVSRGMIRLQLVLNVLEFLCKVENAESDTSKASAAEDAQQEEHQRSSQW